VDDLTDILQCPTTGRTLHWTSGWTYAAANGGPVYPIRDGVICLLPTTGDNQGEDAGGNVRDFYDGGGWTEDEAGLFGDTRAFVDTRPAPLAYTNQCAARLKRYFERGGGYLLDAGSGPLPHDVLLSYGDRFARRVCVDLSAQALRIAKRKLGDRGIYLQGDLTKLPLKTGSMDAITCNHVIYQIPVELQATAFLELWRVLKPGGVAVIVYLWPPHGPLAWRLGKLARFLFGKHEMPSEASDETRRPDAELPHYPQPLSWLQAQNFPFPIELDTFRIVSNPFMRAHVPDDWRGHVFLNALYALQVMAPRFCGRYGEVPAIVLRKPP
jgi:SAM-dependent methyltransferase